MKKLRQYIAQLLETYFATQAKLYQNSPDAYVYHYWY